MIIVIGVSQYAYSGIIVSSQTNKHSRVYLFQNGIAIYLEHGKSKYIVDTKSNNCIVVNHDLKRYLFLRCTNFKSTIELLKFKRPVEYNTQSPIAVQELMTENQPPKTPIEVKQSGLGTYQGFKIIKFQFIVANEVVYEYWISNKLKQQIQKEIDVLKLSEITNDFVINNPFPNSLNTKLNEKFNELTNNGLALKEFRYTGSKTKKIKRKITIKNINIKKYLPPKTYKNTVSFAEFTK